jgi:hypothetical protein
MGCSWVVFMDFYNLQQAPSPIKCVQRFLFLALDQTRDKEDFSFMRFAVFWSGIVMFFEVKLIKEQ